MEKYFLPYDLSMEFKKLGFNKECLGRLYANNDLELLDYKYKNSDVVGNNITSCAAPLIQQAKEWLRDKYKLHIHICYFEDSDVWHSDIYNIQNGKLKNNPMQLTGYKTYKEAELEAIRECIKIIKYEQEKTKEKTL